MRCWQRVAWGGLLAALQGCSQGAEAARADGGVRGAPEAASADVAVGSDRASEDGSQGSAAQSDGAASLDPTDGAVTQDVASTTEAGGAVTDASFCQVSLEAWCARNAWPRCTGDWASTVTNPAATGGSGCWYAASCDSYNLLFDQGIDSGERYYYDKSTGQLVAIMMTGNGGITCLGGPPDFAFPSACSSSMLVCGPLAEGGTDGPFGAVDSGGE